MPVHDRSAMTLHPSRGQLIGRPDPPTPLEAERPVGCPSGHIAAPLTSAIVIREAAQNAGAEARVPDASKQHRTNQARRVCSQMASTLGVGRLGGTPWYSATGCPCTTLVCDSSRPGGDSDDPCCRDPGEDRP